MLAVPSNAAIVELFDPLGRDFCSVSKGDAEGGQLNISDVPLGGFDKGLLVIKETGLGELEVFLQLVNCNLVFLVLGLDLALILLMTAVRSFDKGIDNGTERGWVQIGGGNGIAY